MVSYDVLGPGGRVILHAHTPFLCRATSKGLFSVSESSRRVVQSQVRRRTHGSIAGVQRVPVRVKGKTFGLSIQKTTAWITPETDDAAPHAEVAPVDVLEWYWE